MQYQHTWRVNFHQYRCAPHWLTTLYGDKHYSISRMSATKRHTLHNFKWVPQKMHLAIVNFVVCLLELQCARLVAFTSIDLLTLLPPDCTHSFECAQLANKWAYKRHDASSHERSEWTKTNRHTYVKDEYVMLTVCPIPIRQWSVGRVLAL